MIIIIITIKITYNTNYQYDVLLYNYCVCLYEYKVCIDNIIDVDIIRS